MSMKSFFAALLGVAVLTGCASTPQAPIAFNVAALKKADTRVGIAVPPLPKVDTQFPGANCLLCIAAASAANSSLTQYTQKLPVDDITRIKADLADVLRKKGYTPVMLPDTFELKQLPSVDLGPNKAKFDFASVARQYQIDKLFVVQFTQIGISRNYSAYFPTGAPQGSIRGVGYLVNLADNTYEWYQPIDENKAASGVWDEPPNFPGLTNAYFQAIEGARDAVLKPLSN